jgi:hypothetical protein
MEIFTIRIWEIFTIRICNVDSDKHGLTIVVCLLYRSSKGVSNVEIRVGLKTLRSTSVENIHCATRS